MEQKSKRLEIPLLIVLLVIPIMKQIANIDELKSIVSFLEIIAIPLLIFYIARYIKKLTLREKELLAKKSIVGFFIMQFIYYIINIKDIIISNTSFDFLVLGYNNWILLAIPIWMSLTPLMRKFKKPIIINLLFIYFMFINSTLMEITLLQQIFQLSIYFTLATIFRDSDIIGKTKKGKIFIGINAIISMLLFRFVYSLEPQISLYNTWNLENVNIVKIVGLKLLVLYISLSMVRAILLLTPNKNKEKSKVKYSFEKYITVYVVMSCIIGILSKLNFFIVLRNWFEVIWALSIFSIAAATIMLLPVKTVIIEKAKWIKDKFNLLIEKLELTTEKEDLVEIVPMDKGPFRELRTKLSKFINSRYVTILFGLIILAKSIFFYKNTVYMDEKIWDYTIYSSIIFVIYFMLILLAIINSKVRFNTGLILVFLVSVLLFSDELYYKFASNVISLEQLSNLQYTSEISAALPDLIEPRHILYFIDFVMLGVLVFSKVIKIYSIKQKTMYTTVIITTMLVTIMPNTIIKSFNLIHGFPFNKVSEIRYGTIFGYHIVDVVDVFGKKVNLKYKDYESVEAAYNELKDEYNSKYTSVYNLDGYAKDKNVIILQLESMQNFVVNKTINGKEITPNLNKFLSENVQFTNMHNQSFTTTADSEHSMTTSLYPMENGVAFSRYYLNTYNDIFSDYKQADYYTAYMHGNYGEFWNRKNLFSRLDVDKLNFLNEFEDQSETINKYLSDELMYKQAVQKIKQYDEESKEKPWLVDMVSASSHNPFELEGIQNKESKVSIDVGTYKGTYFGNYLEAVNYADWAFGLFIEQLKQEGLYDDTLMIVYGDHAGVPMYDENMIKYINSTSEKELNDIEIQLNYTNILCGIKIPGSSHTVITKPVSKLDIKPTLTSLSGVNDQFSLGTNMFNNKEFVLVNNGRIITDTYYYNGAWYNIKTGEEVLGGTTAKMTEIEINQLKEKLDTYCRYLEQELDISNSIITNDLLKEKFEHEKEKKTEKDKNDNKKKSSNSENVINENVLVENR